ncbi:MAG TPA: hypothetical protein VJH06_03425 [Candidatus Paceibacterota bacterium]
MIGRKLLMLQNGQITERDFTEINLKAPALEEWKHAAIKGTKKHGYNTLVGIIRFYFRGSNILKNKYEEVRVKVKRMRRKGRGETEKPEISKFLKVVSEYKKKIRKIKQKVKEEENL